MIKSVLTGDRIVSVSEESFTLNQKSYIGEKKAARIEYSGMEALYLIQQGKMKVYIGKKVVDLEKLLKKIKKNDKKIEIKLTVYSDLRNKGYIVKSALKYGAEFRIYDKGQTPEDAHARWIVYCSRESDNLDWHDFSAKNRVAHSTKKNLLIAIVDDEGDVSYYEVGWKRI